MTGSDVEGIERAEAELEEWLAAKATDGVPELVLIGVLREYADEIGQLGYIPRTWEPNDTDYDGLVEPHRRTTCSRRAGLFGLWSRPSRWYLQTRPWE